MSSIVDHLTPIANELVGPHAIIPWWAWAATLVMIFWAILGNHTMTPESEEDQ